ncbi:MAG: glycoside hydrolase family 5 protein [Defluviitaleaceae bacterium]|nr:glycoside hydrolase family 5 protein [Defluviitaleaceae bacterium]
MFKFTVLLILLIFSACANELNVETPVSTPTPTPIPTPAPTPTPTQEPLVAPPPPEINDPPLVINLTEAPDPSPSPWQNASEMVAEMRVGWNLGNTLDAHPHGNVTAFGRPIETHETIWGNPITSRENIETIREAGFDVLRVPVTWYPRLVRNCDNYTIRDDWMERVIQVVNYGLDAGFFVIINTHHDEYLFSLFDDDMDDSIHVITRLWEQIAYVFRDYPHKLIFEGLNEPRTIGSRAEWNGGTPEERHNVNILNQVFVDTVRESGGNNINRMLMVPTYAAAVVAHAIDDFVLPDDPANDENKLIVSLHMYAPYRFALTLGENMSMGWSTQNPEDTNAITRGLDLAYNAFSANGIPIIMGEMGALNRNNTSSRANWTYFYVTEARNRGIVCIWWDNGRFGTSLSRADGDHFAILDRATNTFPFPEIIDSLMRATE